MLKVLLAPLVPLVQTELMESTVHKAPLVLLALKALPVQEVVTIKI